MSHTYCIVRCACVVHVCIHACELKCQKPAYVYLHHLWLDSESNVLITIVLIVKCDLLQIKYTYMVSYNYTTYGLEEENFCIP